MESNIIIKKVKTYKDIKILHELIVAGDLNAITISMLKSNLINNLPMYVAYYNNKPVGQCCARLKVDSFSTDNYYDQYLKSSKYIVLSYINVLDKYKSRGIGSLLLKAFIDNSHLKVLRVDKSNIAAYHLYKKHGFAKFNSYVDMENIEWITMVYNK